MKRGVKVTFFWSGLAALNSLSISVFFWSVIPVGGATLPRVMEEGWNIPFSFSALLVSLCCAFSATGAIGLLAFNPAVVSTEGGQQNVRQPPIP